MAEVQSNESDSGKGGKHKKVRAKKNSTHIDMTPMVDLAFLLLTFFMLTTTFGKPKAMPITMPVKDPKAEITKINNALTFLLSDKNKIYWYEGELKAETVLTPTDYSPNGMRKLLLDYNKTAISKIKEIRNDPNNKVLSDSLIKEKEMAVQAEKSALTVLIKTNEKAKYKNVIDALDELKITMVGKYALVDIDKQEYDMIQKMEGGQ